MLEQLRDYRTTQEGGSTLSHKVSILKTTQTHAQRRGHKLPLGFLFVRMLSEKKSICGIRLLCCFSGWVQPSLPCYTKAKLALGDFEGY